MNGMNLTYIIGIILIVVVLLLLVIFLLMKDKEVEEKTKKKSSSDYYVSLPNIMSISLPPKIEKLSARQLDEISRKIFESYRYFDFKNMSMEELEKKEWHSWQISMLLMLYKKGEAFHLIDQSKYFGSFLLDSNENTIKSLMKSIIKKYENYVAILDGKDKLSKDYIWTNRDVSTIFYFLINYKEYKQ